MNQWKLFLFLILKNSCRMRHFVILFADIWYRSKSDLFPNIWPQMTLSFEIYHFHHFNKNWNLEYLRDSDHKWPWNQIRILASLMIFDLCWPQNHFFAKHRSRASFWWQIWDLTSNDPKFEIWAYFNKCWTNEVSLIIFSYLMV